MSWFRRRRPVPTDRPLSCAEVGRVLQRYLDAEADDALTARVEEHLEDCLRCGLELDTYRRITSSLAERSPALPPDAIDRLRAFGDELAGGASGSAPPER